MIDISKLFSPYDRKARLYPALICVLPLVASISVCYPKLYTSLTGLVALAIGFGLAQFITHLARDKGKKLEPQLFESWGGMPSVAFLRYSNKTLPMPTKQRYHSELARLSSIGAPSADSELVAPKEADEIYSAWCNFLRARTRDTKQYPLIFAENISYGFRRNLLGLKWWCITMSALSILLLIVPNTAAQSFTEVHMGLVLIILTYSLILMIVLNESWVKSTADAYAKNLLEAVNTL